MTGLLPNDAIAVAAGAVLGALSRYHIGRIATEYIANDPNRYGKYKGWHTAAINVFGSFLLGGITGFPGIAAPTPTPPLQPSQPSSISKVTPPQDPFSRMMLSLKFGLSPRAKLLLGVGFCGSFTTFSTYSVDLFTWLSHGETKKAVSYLLVNNVGGMVAAATGLILVKKIFA